MSDEITASCAFTVQVGSENPTLEDVERAVVVDRLEQWEGDKTNAARSLGVSLKTLYNYCHKWGLMPPLKKRVKK